MSNETQNQITEMYKAGSSSTAIGLSLDIHSSTVCKILKKNGVKRDNRIIGPNKLIIALYREGVPVAEIARRFDTNVDTLWSRLRKWGVYVPVQPKHYIDESFFDIIDCQEKAYFLGLLFADGYNGEAKFDYRISISLQLQDEGILKAFRFAIRSTHPIHIDSRDQACFSFHSKYLSERLTQLGCYRAKSLTCTFPDYLTDEMLPHFIRGYIDGDGHIGAKGQREVVSVIGSIPFIQHLADVISTWCQVYVHIQKVKNHTKVITLQIRGRNQVSVVLAWLYKDAYIYLDRKKRSAEIILVPVYYAPTAFGSEVNSSVLIESDVIKIKELILEGIALPLIASRFGVGKTTIASISQGLTWRQVTGWDKENNAAYGLRKGAGHGMAKLTQTDLLTIREMIIEGLTNTAIAKSFSVSSSMISKIRCGHNWS